LCHLQLPILILDLGNVLLQFSVVALENGNVVCHLHDFIQSNLDVLALKGRGGVGEVEELPGVRVKGGPFVGVIRAVVGVDKYARHPFLYVEFFPQNPERYLIYNCKDNTTAARTLS
jgi:hypothetical protein